jgi:hypothetical protein
MEITFSIFFPDAQASLHSSTFEAVHWSTDHSAEYMPGEDRGDLIHRTLPKDNGKCYPMENEYAYNAPSEEYLNST